MNRTSNVRRQIEYCLDTSAIKKAISMGHGPKIFREGDEIDIPLVDGDVMPMQVGYVGDTFARLISRDAIQYAEMNQQRGNPPGYVSSDLRQLLINDVFYRIVPEWRNLIIPRKIHEKIEHEYVDYSDYIWIPSAADIADYYLDVRNNNPITVDATDSFQLPFFTTSPYLTVKQLKGRKICYEEGIMWWLRTAAYEEDSNGRYKINGNFWIINAHGAAGFNIEEVWKIGVVPGFDIGLTKEVLEMMDINH